jgi:hypothetical protein
MNPRGALTPGGAPPLDRIAWETCQLYDPAVESVDAKAKWGALVVHRSPSEYGCKPEVWRQLATTRRVLRELAETMCEEGGGEGKLVVINGWYFTLRPVHERERRVLWLRDPSRKDVLDPRTRVCPQPEKNGDTGRMFGRLPGDAD